MGDNLRAIYDNLSKDPNSFANLDKDLPNYAQVFIHCSLIGMTNAQGSYG